MIYQKFLKKVLHPPNKDNYGYTHYRLIDYRSSNLVLSGIIRNSGHPRCRFSGRRLHHLCQLLCLCLYAVSYTHLSEVAVDGNLKNRFFPIAELGYGSTDTWSDKGIHYTSNAPYFRIGKMCIRDRNRDS